MPEDRGPLEWLEEPAVAAVAADHLGPEELEGDSSAIRGTSLPIC